MKKLIAILLSALFVFSLAGCGSQPSDTKIKQALEDGKITFEDAKAKGWVDEEWIKENFEPIKAKTKIHLFDPFETTYIDGTPAASKIIEGKMCLVFFNTKEKITMDQLAVFNKSYEKLKTIGIPVLGIVTDKDIDTAREKLADVKFPIIIYNEEMQKSLKKYSDIINNDIVSIFTKEGGFYTAWISNQTSENLLSYAQGLADEK